MIRPIETVIAHPSERELAWQAHKARETKAAVNQVRGFGRRQSAITFEGSANKLRHARKLKKRGRK